MLPGETHVFTAKVSLLPGNGIETNLANNSLVFDAVALPIPTVYPAPTAFLPLIFAVD